MNRSMLHAFCGTIALAAVTALPVSAVAQTIPVPAPAPLSEPQSNGQPNEQTVPPNAPLSLPNRSTDTPGFAPDQTQPNPQPLTQEPTISCPAGQFASRFPDVTPNDWAYEAVNRVASGELRCFPVQG